MGATLLHKLNHMPQHILLSFTLVPILLSSCPLKRAINTWMLFPAKEELSFQPKTAPNYLPAI